MKNYRQSKEYGANGVGGIYVAMEDQAGQVETEEGPGKTSEGPKENENEGFGNLAETPSRMSKDGDHRAQEGGVAIYGQYAWGDTYDKGGGRAYCIFQYPLP